MKNAYQEMDYENAAKYRDKSFLKYNIENRKLYLQIL